MPLTKEQHAARLRGIGGSDAAAALGLSTRKTQYQLWHEKTQPPEVQEKDPNDQSRLFGHLMEGAVAHWLASEIGATLVRVKDTLVSSQFPFMLGHPDRAVVNPKIARAVRWTGERLTTDRIAELKTRDRSKRPEWGDAGTDQIPLETMAQCVHYLIVTGVELCEVGVLFGGNSAERFVVPRKPDLIEMVIEGEREFWRMVEEGTPPPVQSLADVRLRYQRDSGREIEATPDVFAALVRYNELDATITSQEQERDACEFIIKKFMGEASVLTVRGLTAATWKASAPPNRFDTKRFEAEHPDLAAKYRSRGDGVGPRRFIVKGIK